jgi:hypothetical protein
MPEGAAGDGPVNPPPAASAGPDASLGDDRRAALLAAKLAALVAGRWGAAKRDRVAFPPGAALTGATGEGRRVAWVLAAERSERVLGPALVWADRQGTDELHVIAEGRDQIDSGPGVGTDASVADDAAGDRARGIRAPTAAGLLARQAALFARPRPSVWRIDGTSLAPADPAPPPRRPPAPAPGALVDLLVDAGLEIVVEGGMVRGEVNGLEVARIVEGETTAGVPIDEPTLEVGVGKADRELTAMVHAGMTPVDQLRRVVEITGRHRLPGAPRHPLNQLVPDRWLRAVLCRNPGAVGLASLRPAEGARPRPNLSERDVAIAAGVAPDGTRVVVACSVGIALDLVPTAADAREVLDPTARLLLAVPERDDHPGTRRLAARLVRPAEVVPVAGDWRSAG